MATSHSPSMGKQPTSGKFQFMFSEPQSVTISGSAKSLPRVSFGDRKGVFEDVSGNRLTVSHTTGRRNRHIVRLDTTKLALDPTLDGVSKEYSMSCQMLIDIPPVGFTAADQAANAKALTDWLATSGVLLKVTSGES